MMVLLLMLLLMMVMTVVQGCTVVVSVASGYRGVTLERNSVRSAAAQIDGVGVIVVVAVCGGESATTANYDIVVVLKASIVVVVVDYDASVASGDTAADCAGIAGRVASGDDVMLLVGRMSGQMLLQDKLVGRGFHRDG